MMKGNCFWILFILMYMDGLLFIDGLHVDTCYTSDSCGSTAITCPTGTLIAPEINYLFKKGSPNTCPGPAGDCDHVCCTFDSADAVDETSFAIPDTSEILQYVVPCLTQESCNIQAPFDNTKDYDYVFFPYSCLAASKMVDMVNNVASETFNGDASVFYSGAIEATPGTNCSCQVTSTSQMTITSIYVYLDEITCPQVKLSTDGSLNIVPCDTSGFLSMEDDFGPGNQFYLELNGLNATEYNVIWIKFETDPAADINVQCNGCSRSATVAPPEAAEPLVVATCYTDSGTCSTVDITCPTNNAIAPSLHYLVKKQTPNSCPGPAGDCSNVCCTVDEADFTDTNYEISDGTLTYVNQCIKKNSCVFQSTYNASLPFHYNAYFYFCIPETSIVNMKDNIASTTFNGEVSIYYSAVELPSSGNNCSCAVTSATSMLIKSYYAFLDSSSCPKIIATVSGADLYTCNAGGYLSFEEDFGTTNQLYIEIQNVMNADPTNVIWFSASTGSTDEISVSCTGCINSASTTSPATTTSTSTQLTPTSTTSPTTSPTTTQSTNAASTASQESTVSTQTSTTSTASPTTTTYPTTTQSTNAASTASQESTASTQTSTTSTATPTTTTGTTTTQSTNAASTALQESTASNSNAGKDNSTVTNTTILTNSGEGKEPEATASSTGLIIGVSATLGVLVLGVTATHGVLYLIHKSKNSKVSP